ncbi:pentatricopeptide repeat-containing protein At3g46790, chloroplastic-like [Andrographis paniculata]|uniref:pentatricopeptide repeat-containing protein At3g46790, chloroplastic-like n=1 Tax=Andrographis paniculata TaxID=175694 RepID=UPI0021E71455|nr:pentatricopeptide repeat-containing protein At3g46790, chloroplastic-like [Andrographis paniculata]
MIGGLKTQISPNLYASILKSCISRKSIGPGKQLHSIFILNGSIFHDVNLATKLVNLYSVCNSMPYARYLFDRMPKSNIFLWNVLIRGYAWHGPYEDAISLYNRLSDHKLVPDNFTFPFVLKACSALSAANVGRKIHARVRDTGWNTDVFVAAALIDMYAKCGCVADARQVFDEITERDVVLWNSMLAAYAQNRLPAECLRLCAEMAAAASPEFRPTEGTIVTAVSASADSMAVGRGRELHGYSWRLGFGCNDKVKTGLIDMYAKSGNLTAARFLFDRLTAKRLVAWNAMITGYAMHGHAHTALDLFNRMAGELRPDHITFIGVLSACNHGGLLEQGWNYFDSMVKDYGLEQSVEHYTCMVDLLGRFNRLNEAYDMIINMRATPDAGVWGALLNSCKIHKNVELGEAALERLVELEPGDAGNYIMLSNIYAQSGKWEGVTRLRRSMAARDVKKSVGCSWIEVRTEIHAFVSGDTTHLMSDEIYAELRSLGDLLARAGYVPNTSPVFYDVESDEKTAAVSSHSERLAIAFGLVATPPGTRLLVTKNLRVCEDCHTAIKLVSRIKGREIVVRDVNRYHHFKNGACSCSDFW